MRTHNLPGATAVIVETPGDSGLECRAVTPDDARTHYNLNYLKNARRPYEF